MLVFSATIAGIILIQSVSASGSAVSPEQRIDTEPFIVECTAYCDDGITASGKPTVDGLTIAGAREWIGCVAMLYEVDADGTIGDFIGMYEVTDTGYGIDGDIRRGETVDIFMSDEDACWEWGRRKVYAQIINGKG
jgi:3D (Asp-Asp-Asp) domain-containing protein